MEATDCQICLDHHHSTPFFPLPCPQDHKKSLVHLTCLIQWLNKDKGCHLCRTQYSLTANKARMMTFIHLGFQDEESAEARLARLKRLFPNSTKKLLRQKPSYKLCDRIYRKKVENNAERSGAFIRNFDLLNKRFCLLRNRQFEQFATDLDRLGYRGGHPRSEMNTDPIFVAIVLSVITIVFGLLIINRP